MTKHFVQDLDQYYILIAIMCIAAQYVNEFLIDFKCHVLLQHLTFGNTIFRWG